MGARGQPWSCSLVEVLRAVQRHCTIIDIAESLGVHTSTVRRHLVRAESAELVTATRGSAVNQLVVWELTPLGVARLAKHVATGGELLSGEAVQ
jgi:predicted ArsR family transcriptional regulator